MIWDVNVLLNLLCKYFFENFSIYVHQRYWSLIYRFLSFIFCVPLSSFGIRVMLASWNELVIPSPPFSFSAAQFWGNPCLHSPCIILASSFSCMGLREPGALHLGLFFPCPIFKDAFKLPVTSRYSRLILCISCPTLRVSHCFFILFIGEPSQNPLDMP